MTEKKVVIKINKKRSEQIQPQMITVWNTGRIVTTVALIIIIVGLLFYVFSGDEGKNAVVVEEIKQLKTIKPEIIVPAKEGKQIIQLEGEKIVKQADITTEEDIATEVSINSKRNIKSQAAVNDDNVVKVLPVIFDRRVSRSILANGLNNKEPVGELSESIEVNKTKAVRVYYFTEINNMKGQVLFHQWYRNDKLVFNRQINILGNRWRASTSKLLPYSAKGHWLVKLVDESGNILSKVKFEVI